MATTEEILEAYADWRERCNANPRLTKMLRNWDRVAHLVPNDLDERFGMQVRDRVLSELRTGAAGQADLIVTASSEDFADLFWGDLNPSEKYLRGEIVISGAQEDVMRLDAISMMAFLAQ